MTISSQGESPDNIDELASEYVLGTLSTEQRIDVQKRLAQEADLRAAVDAWEQRLLALTALAEPQIPTPLLWGRIERSLNSIGRRAPQMNAATQPISWWNRLPLWRGLAGAGLAATLLLGAVLLTRTGAVHWPCRKSDLTAISKQGYKKPDTFRRYSLKTQQGSRGGACWPPD